MTTKETIEATMDVPVVLPGSDGQAHHADGHDVMIGRSPQILEAYKSIGRVAPQSVTVLVRGESGTEKELIARAICQHSRRSRGPVRTPVAHAASLLASP